MAALALPGLALLGAFAFAPVVRVLWLSFHDANGLSSPSFVGLDGYAALARSPSVQRAALCSLACVAVTPVLVALSLGLALLVERATLTNRALRAAYFIPAVTSTIAVGVVWRILLEDDAGWVNRALGTSIPWLTGSFALGSVLLVVLWRGLGYYMLLYLAALARAPVSLREAAALDGAGPITTFRAAIWPSVRSTAFLAAALSASAALKVFDEVMVLTGGGPLGRTTTLVFLAYESAFATFPPRLGTASAIGVILSLLAALALLATRWASARRATGGATR